MRKLTTMAAALALGLLGSTAARAGDVRIMWYSDGIEGEVVKDLLARFSKANPDINVILDQVSFSVVREQLPVQLESGTGPDIARVTALKVLNKHWLDLRPLLSDPAYWDKNYGEEANWIRPDGSNAIDGFMTQITEVGGFANKTLFEQAGVPMPGKGATWDDWAKATKAVADSQKVPFPMAMDRSGHRLTGPLLSAGADLIAPDGKPAPLDAAAEGFLSTFVGWVKGGVMDKDVWVSAAGSTYRAGSEDFIGGQAVFYYSGSWQVPNFSTKIGQSFDWVATGNPCGKAACTGLPGGAGLVAIKYTKNPKQVARVMEYLASEDVAREFYERSLFLPANKSVREKGLTFKTADPQAKAALDKFVADLSTITPAAFAMPAWKWNEVFYAAVAARVGQAAAGEMSDGEAFKRIDSDAAAKVAEASR